MANADTKEMASHILLYDQNKLSQRDREWCEGKPGFARVTLAALAVIMERLGVDLQSLDADDDESGIRLT